MQIFNSVNDALNATDKFYEDLEGFQYTEESTTEWVRAHVPVPTKGRVLDLCCGDGIWAKAFQNLNPDLELFGIDISSGGIRKAASLLGSDGEHFVVGDAEAYLPFETSYFEVIFARGPGLYNQHSMDRPDTISVIEMWHRHLVPGSGRFYSIFASNPRLMGKYTPMEECTLPYNRAPRKTPAGEFSGGKLHHSISSFLAPFWKVRRRDGHAGA